MPRDALSHQMPGAIIEAVAGVRLPDNEELDTLARATLPARTAREQGGDV
jgi:hypothetical protein